ncbi:MAG TPA: MFS transporter [Candidatus Limnocylindria bacterium]|nr:MFS transporter [Candidatus Limnocylindria bacterium]
MFDAMRSDFWKFWVGETISNFGNSITFFALPLLVFKLTGSAVSLGVAFAMFGLPHLFFGLLIGAWVDRLDRKRVMIVVDVLSAAALASIPLASAAGVLTIWWIYATAFVLATLGIFFQAAQFAAIPSLVERDQLVTANGRIQASFSAATVVGPLAAGALLALVPVESLLYLDALTFLLSAVALTLIARPFNAPSQVQRSSIRADVVEGLRYVLRHPVLRNISLMMALINFLGVTVFAQLVLFAKQRFAVSDSELGLLFAADGAGVVLLSLAAGPLRSRYSFGNVALGALMLSGVMTFALAYAPSYLFAVLFSALSSGFGILFNINTGSLRQQIVPNHLLGRIITIAMVLAWSANPLGATIGGLVVERTGDVQTVYAVIGVLVFAIALYFRLFSPLGQAERYLEMPAEARAG